MEGKSKHMEFKCQSVSLTLPTSGRDTGGVLLGLRATPNVNATIIRRCESIICLLFIFKLLLSEEDTDTGNQRRLLINIHQASALKAPSHAPRDPETVEQNLFPISRDQRVL